MFGPGGPRAILDRETLKPKSTGATLARLAQHFGPFWPALLAAAFFIIISTWAQVTTPELIGQLVDCYLAPAAASAFGSFPGRWGKSADNSQANCWLSEGRTPSGFTQTVVKTVFTAGSFAAPTADAATLTQEQRFAGLGRMIVLIISLYAAGALLTGLTFFAMSWTGQHVLRALRAEIFQHLHALPLSYYAEHEAGDLMSRITNDTETIQPA